MKKIIAFLIAISFVVVQAIAPTGTVYAAENGVYKDMKFYERFFRGGFANRGPGHRVIDNGLWSKATRMNQPSKYSGRAIRNTGGRELGNLLVDELQRIYNSPSCCSYSGGRAENDRVGVRFIVMTMLGENPPRGGSYSSTPDFNRLRNQLNRLVDQRRGSISIRSITGAYTGVNTKLLADGSDVIYYNGKVRVSPTIEIRDSNGTLLYKLKLDCGNPLAGDGLPPPTPSRAPVVTLDPNCRGGYVRGTAIDPDLPGARLWIEVRSGDVPSKSGVRLDDLNGDNGGSGTRTDSRGNFYISNSVLANMMRNGVTLYAGAVGRDSDGGYTVPVPQFGLTSKYVASCRAYDLRSSSQANDLSVPRGDDARITHRIRNVGDGTASDTYTWAVKQFIIPPGGGVPNTSRFGSGYYQSRIFDYTHTDRIGTQSYQLDSDDYAGIDCSNTTQSGIYAANDRTRSTLNGNPIQTNCMDTVQPIWSPSRPRPSISPGRTHTFSTVSIDTSPYRAGTRVCQLLAVDYATTEGARHRWGRPVCVVVAKAPSLAVTGGDVAAGRRAGSTDGINISYRGSGGNCYGGWLEYAAIAPGDIRASTATSVLGGQCTNDTVRNSMAFANHSRGSTAGRFGSLGARADLTTNYATVAPTRTGITSLNLNSYTTPGVYRFTGNTVRVSGTVQPGVTIILDASKIDVQGDITYADGPYTSLNQIPQLILRSSGNIVVRENVRRIDAWMVAAGTISTCNEPGTSRYYSGLTVSTCDQPLQINGPISAAHLHLRRTFGGEGVNLSDRRTTAEHINFRAETYMWGARVGQSGGDLIIQNIQELPPLY